MKNHIKNNKANSFNGSGWVSIRSLANESGAALVVALLLMVVMVTMIPVAVQLTTGEFDRTENFQGKQDSFFIADAGMERLKSIYKNVGSTTALSGPDSVFTTTADNGTFGGAAALAITDNPVVTFSFEDDFTSDTDGQTHDYTKVEFNGGDYKIRIWDNTDGTLCPTCTSGNADPFLDSDNEAWIDRDGTVYAESIGTTADGQKTTIVATLKRPVALANQIAAAMTLVGPKAWYKSNSNAGWTQGSNGTGSGFGINNGNTDTDCIGKEGIVMEAEKTPTLGDWENLTNADATDPLMAACVDPGGSNFNACFGWSPANSEDDVAGMTAGGIVTGSTDFTALDAEALFDTFVVDNTPDQVLAVDGPITDMGTATNPVVIHATGDLSINGGTGYGVLVVDGNLDLAGNIIWNGIIIVSGCDDCTGSLTGAGTFEVNGALIIGNDGLDAGDDTISVSNYGGKPRYRYSCEGVDIANGALSGDFLAASWNELIVQ